MNTTHITQIGPAPEPPALANSPTQTPTIEPTENLQPAETATPATPATPADPEAPLNTSSIDGVLGVVDKLSDAERAEFQDNEATIRNGSLTFFEVGLALANIRDKQLFREDFDSFEAYYQARWEMQHAKAYYLIAAARVYSNLATLEGVPKPERESQLRPMLSLPAEHAQLAWQCAVLRSGGRHVTARHVKGAIRELHLTPDPGPTKRPARRNRKEQRRQVNDAFGELLLLLGRKAPHEVLTQKVEALHRLFQACVAD